MTHKDYLLFKSWGDLRPDKPHALEVGRRVCLPCLARTSGQNKNLNYGSHTKANCNNPSPVYPILGGQPEFWAPGQGGSTFHPFPKESIGDRFYAVLRKLRYQLNKEGDYA